MKKGLQHAASQSATQSATQCNTVQHSATQCNTVQHSATRCNTVQHGATRCNTVQHGATQCNTVQHTTTHYNTLQHTYYVLEHRPTSICQKRPAKVTPFHPKERTLIFIGHFSAKEPYNYCSFCSKRGPTSKET